MKKKRQNWKKIIGLIVLIFVCIFSVFGILMIFLKTEMPLTVVSSESMVPSYYPGDLLLVKKVDEGEILPLDVIIFWPLTWGLERSTFPMVPIVHRVINVSRDPNRQYYSGSWYQTRGDLFTLTPEFMDPYIPHFCVIGKVVGRIPFLGLPKLWIDALGGNVVIYFILIILVILLVYTLLPRKEDEEEKEINNEETVKVGLSF